MNPIDYGNLVNALGSKATYDVHETGELGFTYLKLHLSSGTVKVFEDFQCPRGYAYLLKMDTWKWHGLKKSGPRITNTDGRELLREATDDGVEVRMANRGQLVCVAPGYNAVVTLPT